MNNKNSGETLILALKNFGERRKSSINIYYHTWAKDEKHSYEVDFLISRGSKVCPIEVKSSGYRTHASLDAFCNKYSDRVGERYLIYTKDYAKDGATILLPVFMTPLI